jgi:hypothetical protein
VVEVPIYHFFFIVDGTYETHANKLNCFSVAA